MHVNSLNLIVLSGFLERAPVVRWNESGQPVANATLRLEEHGQGGVLYKTYVPMESYGQQAERLGELGAGDLVSVEGKIKWTSRVLKNGEKKSSLAVLIRTVSLLVSAPSLVSYDTAQ